MIATHLAYHTLAWIVHHLLHHKQLERQRYLSHLPHLHFRYTPGRATGGWRFNPGRFPGGLG